jgi:EAL and modified HD-GYP domain-containing signal transduction protein
MLKHFQEFVHEEIRKTLRDLADSSSGEKSPTLDVATAKQPIFDATGNIWGYELLYRSLPDAQCADIVNGAVATARIITSGVEAARHSLRPGQKLLINFPTAMIEARAITLLPSEQCMLEILEDVEPTPGVIEALKEMKAAGYGLVLDDYVGQENLAPFLPLVDIVKFDVLNRDKQAVAELVNSLVGRRCIRLAEKVEDEQTRKFCQEQGCILFQGYFFSRPELMVGRSYSTSLAERMRIYALLGENPVNIKALSDAILHIPVLTAKLLALVNSPFFSFTEKISSVQRALQLMGTVTFTQWLCVSVLASLDHSPMSIELSFLASQRAKFLERLGLLLQKRGCLPPDIMPQELFFLGLFSLLEAIAKLPLTTILEGVPLEAEVINALLGRESRYAGWLTILAAYQRGEWEVAIRLAADYGLEESDMSSAWAFALRWSSEFFFPEQMAHQCQR